VTTTSDSHGLCAELSRALSKFTTQKANGSRVDYADDAVGIAVSIAWDGDLGSELRTQNSGSWGQGILGGTLSLPLFTLDLPGCLGAYGTVFVLAACRMPLYLFIT